MKRGLVFTLCALAVTATATLGRAQTVDLTLNLRYNDPNTPASGGAWYLLGKTTGGGTNLGLAGVSVFLDGVSTSVSHGNGVVLGAGQNPNHHDYSPGAAPNIGQATINNLANAGNPFNGTFTGSQNVVYGQDLSIAGIISGIGLGSGAGNVALDPLKNTSFNNYAVLLSGTFLTATRPSFSTVAGKLPQANVLVSTTPGTAAVAATTITTHVRGDSIIAAGLNTPPTSGLRPGDANRDGTVNSLDFSLLSGNWLNAAATWDQGNFNSVGGTQSLDFSILSGNWLQSGVPPTVGAVPEPASFALLGIALLGLAKRARRR